MIFFGGFIACLLLGLINLPFYLMDGNVISLCAMIFCGSISFAMLLMAVTNNK